MDTKEKAEDNEAENGGKPINAMLVSLHAETPVVNEAAIRARIYTVRGVQVIFGRRFGTAVWRRGQVPPTAGQEKRRTFSGGFRDASPSRRCPGLEVPKCHLKTRRRQIWVAGFHGTRPRHAFGGADVTVATSQKSVSRFLSRTAIDKFNKQNPTLSVRTTGVFHDRFLILDGKELYHFGASLKDLGRLYYAVSKMDGGFIPSILARI